MTPKGIIAVDLFGLPADYERISKIAKEENLFLIENAAQSFGATYAGKRAGALGDIGATSFFPAKPLGCYGDGGAILTDDDGLAHKMRSIRVHGRGKEKCDNVRIGINGRLDTIQAGILLAKLNIFDDEVASRQEVESRYAKVIKDMLTVPFVPEGFTSVWAQYTVVREKRAQLMAGLKEVGIPTAIYYPKPLHMQTAFSFLGYPEGSLPVSEKASAAVFSLPMHPYLTESAQDRIIEALAACALKNTGKQK
jgi:UDP-2-acetamido-2-deoxy-ribo-hexuluronate aminotransferase